MIKAKKILLLLVAISMMVGCQEEKKQESEAVAETPPVEFPYDISYSSSFAIGNPAYAQMIVQGSWKDWEDNNLDNMKNWVSDSILVMHSDNETVRGLDAMMARWKAGRASLKAVKVTVDAVTPIYSKDKKEDWVLVWATEISTHEDGITDTTGIMETWRINKAGKADWLLQFDRKNRKK